nr:hypothetical protein [Tanacetum cinerariifolium]
MASKSSQAVVLPKFDMHIHTSNLTTKELKEVVTEYCIPTDLHPRLPPPEFTMNKLSPRYIGIYTEQLEQGGLWIHFSTFFLNMIKHFGVNVAQLVLMGVNRVILFEIHYWSLDINPIFFLFRVFYKLYKQGHWFSFENKIGGRAKKCIKEVSFSLKGWKKKFFLIDRQAIPDAMPWRHIDTYIRDDFPTNYNEGDVERLAEFVITLCPYFPHLLYVCWLTTACQHPRMSYSIKDTDKKGNQYDMVLLSVDLERRRINKSSSFEPDPSMCAKAQAKRAGEGGSVTPQKKRVWKNQEPARSGSKGTLSATTLHQAVPTTIDATTATTLKDITWKASPDTHLGELDCLRPYLQRQMQINDGLSKKFVLLDNAYSTCSERERELTDRLKDMEKEMDDWKQTASEQIQVLESEKSVLVAELAQAEMDSHKLIWEFIPTVVKRLHTSVEYQKSLAAPVSLCFTTGWLGGLSLGKNQEEIAAMFFETSNLDIEGSKT